MEWTRLGITKHAESVLAMDRRWEGKLCKNIGEHVIGWAPNELDGALFDEVADVVIFNINVLRLVSRHVVGGQSDTALVVLVDTAWTH